MTRLATAVFLIALTTSANCQSSVLGYGDWAGGVMGQFAHTTQSGRGVSSFGAMAMATLNGTIDVGVGFASAEQSSLFITGIELHVTRPMLPRAPVIAASLSYSTPLSNARYADDRLTATGTFYYQLPIENPRISPYFSVASFVNEYEPAAFGGGISLGILYPAKRQALAMRFGIITNGDFTIGTITIGGLAIYRQETRSPL